MRPNNYTFRNLIFTLFLVMIAAMANSQGTVQTPMGKTVYLEPGYDTPQYIAIWESNAAQWIIDNQSDAQKKGSATSHYNCHSYAWNVSEGGSSTNSWMNQTYSGNPNLSKYWTNDAYISTLYVADHEKIFYSTGDHSAITTATSGKVKSKWGAWPLYEHSTAKCPYTSSALIYNTLKSITISNASGVICSGTQRTLNNGFTASNWNYDWNVTGYLNQVSGDGTPNYTVSGTSAIGYGTTSLTITSPSGMTASTQKHIGVNTPYPEDLSYSIYTSGGTPVSYMCANTHYHVYLTNNSGCSLSNYTWSVPSAWSTNYTWGDMISVYTNSTPGGMVEVYATTCCGVYTKVKIGYLGSGYCGGYYAMSLTPNPSSGETTLTIEPTSEDAIFDENAEWEVEIFDQMQVLKEKRLKLIGKDQRIQTSGWKSGIYIVRVKYKGENLQAKLVVK
ncbi:MAG: T9SS type A sorting domain-containing protein [Bacteroidota bacterium]|nr:T9SS type A sorting domain-containing protein [Bacteroidota bacterium]